MELLGFGNGLVQRLTQERIAISKAIENWSFAQLQWRVEKHITELFFAEEKLPLSMEFLQKKTEGKTREQSSSARADEMHNN